MLQSTAWDRAHWVWNCISGLVGTGRLRTWNEIDCTSSNVIKNGKGTTKKEVGKTERINDRTASITKSADNREDEMGHLGGTPCIGPRGLKL